jgi:hypothetical protein
VRIQRRLRLAEDGDGHYAVNAACGATSSRADDCDDHDAAVYPGHPEICDGADNNCNGIADEGVWQLGTSVALTKGTDFPVGNALGTETTPGVAATNEGFAVVATADGTTGAVEAFRLSAAGKLLGSATLATAAGTDCPPSSGKRVAFPTLASDDANLLAGYFQAVPQANSCCAANARWTRSVLGVATPVDLSKPTPLGFDSDADTACTTAVPTGQFATASTDWLPSQSKYVATWVDAHSGTARAWIATVSSQGVLGGVHAVTADESDSTPAGGAFPPSLVTASPTRVFVAFAGVNTLRMVLLDPATLSTLVGPQDLPNSFQASPLAVAYSGGRFFVARSTRGATLEISAIDAATLQELRVASISIGSGALLSPRLVPVGNGVLLVFSRGATRLSFGWAPASFDAVAPEVFPLTDVDLGTSVSGAGAAKLDDQHVGLSWVDGTVKAAVLGCGG